VKRHLDAGYTHIKIKVGGMSVAGDLARIETALSLLAGPDHLAVDANAALSLERAREYARALAPYRLRWFEEPCGPVNYRAFAELAAIYDPALATGENLFCLDDVENLLAFGGFRYDRDILQVDPPQAYGIDAYARMTERVEARGGTRKHIYPHGGNMMSFALAAGLGLGGCESYPGVFGAFGGFAEGMEVRAGEIAPPSHAGVGFEAQPALYAIMRALSDG